MTDHIDNPPVTTPHYATTTISGDLGNRGMSLLDYLAAAALPALITSIKNADREAAAAGKSVGGMFAEAAYNMAEFMLEERARRAQQPDEGSKP